MYKSCPGFRLHNHNPGYGFLYGETGDIPAKASIKRYLGELSLPGLAKKDLGGF